MNSPRTRTDTDTRLRIWEVECPLLDAVLALSFDAGELLNCCQSAGVDAVPSNCLRPAHQAVLLAHRACHEPSPLALLLERRLDLVHGESLRLLEDLGAEALFCELLHTPVEEFPDLAGRLWALATVKGEEFTALRAHLRAVLAMGGLLALKREV